MKTLCLGPKQVLSAAVVVVASLALVRIHVRVQATLTGYDIGRLKGEESKLLEERAGLKMQLAKLTAKKHLMLMTDATSDDKAAQDRTYAQQ